jgi:exoribonuclease II
MKNSGLNFLKFPVTNGTAFSAISEKEDNLARYTHFFGNFLPGFSVPFDLPPGISGTGGAGSEAWNRVHMLPRFRPGCPG